MHRNLPPAPRRDVVQRPLAFEPGEGPLDRLPLLPKDFVARKAGLPSFAGDHIYSVRGDVNDGVRMVLIPYQPEQRTPHVWAGGRRSPFRRLQRPLLGQKINALRQRGFPSGSSAPGTS